MSTDGWGIYNSYTDGAGQIHETADATRLALMNAMGVSAHQPPPISPVRVFRGGKLVSKNQLPGPGTLHLEQGVQVPIELALPPDTPLGYHLFQPANEQPPQRWIVAPDACLLPPLAHQWGWAVQLYAARSRKSWGMGDLADLAQLGSWAKNLGASFLLINPLSAAAPVLPQESSPYYPSSRRYRNPLFIQIESVPGANSADLDLAPLIAAGHELNANRHIQRDAIYQLKMTALQQLWLRFVDHDPFNAYLTEQGPSLWQFATYCALAERHGADWRVWPEELRNPAHAAVERFAESELQRVRFHAWLQWLIDRQLAAAAHELPLMQDLPIGVQPSGADGWAWQDLMATGVNVGAPPDAYNNLGQDWGLPPFVPHRLQAAGYDPFIETIRASLRHAGGLRIDHVMGLFRLYWIPSAVGPRGGGYVRYPSEDLLSIVALESHRAGAYIVGEDLGTVEPAVRDALLAHQIMSYRLFWFENVRPEEYSEMSLAALTTHDLPTVAGLWTGFDFQAQKDVGLSPHEGSTQEMHDRLRSLTDATDETSTAEVIVRAHRRLAAAPSIILTATIDDALAVPERPNMPGTVSEWPNWSIALPVPIEELEHSALAREIAEAMKR